MNRILLAAALIGIGLSSCGTSEQQAATDSVQKVELTKKQLSDSIAHEENVMRTSKTYIPQQAMSAMRLYIEYANKYPDDTLTPEYLFRASDIAQGTGNYEDATQYLEKIIDHYTGYNKYPDAVFAAALIYDQYLEKVGHGADRARELYGFLIEKYPTTNYAEQAKVLVDFVGKPDSVYDNYIEAKMKEQENSK